MSTKTNLNSWLQKAAATESSRPVLTWQYSDGAVSMTADGYRAHFVWDGAPEGFTALKKSVNGGDAGKFPDVLFLTSRDFPHTVTVNAADFQRALKIVHAFRDGNYSAVTLTFDRSDTSIHGGQLILSAHSAERGDVQTAIPYYGMMSADFCQRYNAHYLMDAASGFEGNLYLKISTADNPLLIGEMGKQVALVMPMGMDKAPSIFSAETTIQTQRTQTQPDGDWTPFAQKAKKTAQVNPMTPAYTHAQVKFDCDPLTESGLKHLESLKATDSQHANRERYGLAAAQRRKTLSAANRPGDLPAGGRMDAVVVIESPLAAVQTMLKDLTQWASIYHRPIYASFNPTNGALYLQTLPGESYRVFVNGHTSIQRIGSSLGGKRYQSEVGFGKSVAYKTILSEVHGWAESYNIPFHLLNKAPRL